MTDDGGKTERGKPGGLIRALRLGVLVATGIVATGLAGAAILGWLGDLWWPLELFAHFRLIYLLLAGIFALLALTVSWRWSAVVVVAALPHLYVVLEPSFAAATSAARANSAPTATLPGTTQTRRLRILVANVNFTNRRTAALVALIRREKPDVIILQEFALHWPAVLGELPSGYRYRAQGLALRSDSIIVSRFPIRNVRILASDRLRFPPLRADIDVDGTVVRVIGLHLPLPLHRWGHRNQTLYLETVARAARGYSGAVIVAGDFNLTHWTRRMARFAAAGGLTRVAPAGLFAQTRYPPGFGIFRPLLGLPIDHVFVRGPIRPRADRIGPDIGSDHRPQIVDLELATR